MWQDHTTTWLSEPFLESVNLLADETFRFERGLNIAIHLEYLARLVVLSGPKRNFDPITVENNPFISGLFTLGLTTTMPRNFIRFVDNFAGCVVDSDATSTAG